MKIEKEKIILIFILLVFLGAYSLLFSNNFSKLESFDTEKLFGFDINQILYHITTTSFHKLLNYPQGNMAPGYFIILKISYYAFIDINNLFYSIPSYIVINYYLHIITAILGTITLYLFYNNIKKIIFKEKQRLLFMIYLATSFLYIIIFSTLSISSLRILVTILILSFIYTKYKTKNFIIILSLLSGLNCFIGIHAIILVIATSCWLIIEKRYKDILKYILLTGIILIILSIYTAFVTQDSGYLLTNTLNNIGSRAINSSKLELLPYVKSIILSFEDIFYYSISPPQINPNEIYFIKNIIFYFTDIFSLLFFIFQTIVYFMISKSKKINEFQKEDKNYLLFLIIFLIISILFYSIFNIEERYSHLPFLFPFTLQYIIMLKYKYLNDKMKSRMNKILFCTIALSLINNIRYILKYLI